MAMAFNECLYKPQSGGTQSSDLHVVYSFHSRDRRRTSGLPYAREAQGVVGVHFHDVCEVSLVDESTTFVDDVQRIQSHFALCFCPLPWRFGHESKLQHA